MNIRELKLFRHLAGTLHFGRTSQACHITPSGLSRAMQRLETELGHDLFLRDNRSVQLTSAGRLFMEYAEESLHRWSELENRLRQDQKLRGELSLYCSVTAIISILPAIFSKFQELHPDVTLHLETGDAAMALDKLKSGEADVSIAALPSQTPENLDYYELMITPLIFIAPKHYPQTIISKNGEIDWRRTPVIIAERGLSRERVNRWFAEKKIQPNIYSQVAGNEAIMAMVSMGCGIGVVPRLVLEKSLLKYQVAKVEITPELTPFSVGVCTVSRNRRNPVIEAFWNVATSKSASDT